MAHQTAATAAAIVGHHNDIKAAGQLASAGWHMPASGRGPARAHCDLWLRISAIASCRDCLFKSARHDYWLDLVDGQVQCHLHWKTRARLKVLCIGNPAVFGFATWSIDFISDCKQAIEDADVKPMWTAFATRSSIQSCGAIAFRANTSPGCRRAVVSSKPSVLRANVCCRMSVAQILSGTEDRYEGIQVDPDALPNDPSEFSLRLTESLLVRCNRM